jgi:XRN 5'-3' exonuclease N-terminus
MTIYISMGFKHLLTFLYRTIRGHEFSPELSKNTKNLIVAIDANFIIHQLLYIMDLPLYQDVSKTLSIISHVFMSRCYKEMRAMYDMILPNTISLLIILDGDGPNMKLRCQSSRTNSVASRGCNNQKFAKDLFQNKQWMEMLCNFIRNRLETLNPRPWLHENHPVPIDTIFSDSLQDGEGEHKLIRYAAKIVNTCDQQSLGCVTSDTDLIVLCLSNLNYLDGFKDVMVKIIHKPYESPMFNIRHLKLVLEKIMGNSNSWFISWLLMGNDFIPCLFACTNVKRNDIFISCLQHTLALQSVWNWDYSSSTDIPIFIKHFIRYMNDEKHIKIRNDSLHDRKHLSHFWYLIIWNIMYFTNPSKSIGAYENPIIGKTDAEFRNCVLNELLICSHNDLIQSWNEALSTIVNNVIETPHSLYCYQIAIKQLFPTLCKLIY